MITLGQNTARSSKSITPWCSLKTGNKILGQLCMFLFIRGFGVKIMSILIGDPKKDNTEEYRA